MKNTHCCARHHTWRRDAACGLLLVITLSPSFAAAENKIHVHDLHATVLHLLGIDDERLTFRYSGRDFRLTDVSGTVVHDILA